MATLMPIGPRSITSLSIAEAARKPDGSLETVHFRRVQVPEDAVQPYIIKHEAWSHDFLLPDGPPPRQKTPPPDTPIISVHLETSIGGYISSGHSGIIYGANIFSGSPPLPPLVFKFGRKNRNSYLFREAFFYDELETLQGTVLPKYFGYFQAIIPIDWSIEPWLQFSNRQDLFYEDPEKEDDEGCFWRRGYYSEEVQQTFIKDFGRRDIQILSLIVLEQLGGPYISVGYGSEYQYQLGRPMPDEMQKMVMDAFRRLGELGIEHGDVRLSNILKVIDGDHLGGSDGNISGSDISFPFRLIDLELAAKTNGSAKFYENGVLCWVEDLLGSIEDGILLEQNAR